MFIWIIILIIIVVFAVRADNNRSNKNTTKTIQKNNIPTIKYEPKPQIEHKSFKHHSVNFTKEVFNDFVSLDFETTGLSANIDKIIEVAATKYSNGKMVNEFHSLIDPEMHIPSIITKINNIDDIMVEGCPKINEIVSKLLEFIGDLPIVAHNASFDIGFLNANIDGDGYVKNKVIDTLDLSRMMYKSLDNHKLITIKKYFKMDLDSHRASDDTKVAAEIYIRYCKKEEEKINAEKLKREKIIANIEKPTEYDNIDDDIYKCFIAHKTNFERNDGTLKQFHEIEDKISEICKDHKGRYFKTQAKTAKFAIIFDYKFTFHAYVKELKAKGYKVTSFKKALEYFGLSYMWDFNTMDELKQNYVEYLKSNC